MDAKEKLLDNGYEDVIVFSDPSYGKALIGVTSNNQAVYDYDLMVESLMEENDWTYEDAIDWIDFNTIRSLPYVGIGSPVVMYPLY